MNRKRISKAISDIDDAFIYESMHPPVVNADHSPERTKHMGKYENKRHGVTSRRLIGLVLAACLIFTLAVTAYALNLFGIREMFRTEYRELPEAADPYIQHHTEATAAQEEWSARVTESLCDTFKILTTVTVSGGDKYVVVPTDVMPDDRIGIIGMDGDQTLKEYAAAQGKELLFVGASLRRNEQLGIFTEAQTFVNISATEMNILVESERSAGADGGDAICQIYARDEAGNQLDLEVPFTLEPVPASATGSFVPDNPNAIAGITVKSMTAEETPLGWTVCFNSTVTDFDAFENIKKMDSDELTYFEGGGFVLQDDGSWNTTWTMGKGEISNTLTVHFYNWDNQRIGDIVFQKK